MPYNNIEIITEVLAKHSADIAAVIIEPVAGNMGLVLPKRDIYGNLRNYNRTWRIIVTMKL